MGVIKYRAADGTIKELLTLKGDKGDKGEQGSCGELLNLNMGDIIVGKWIPGALNYKLFAVQACKQGEYSNAGHILLSGEEGGMYIDGSSISTWILTGGGIIIPINPTNEVTQIRARIQIHIDKEKDLGKVVDVRAFGDDIDGSFSYDLELLNLYGIITKN